MHAEVPHPLPDLCHLLRRLQLASGFPHLVAEVVQVDPRQKPASHRHTFNSQEGYTKVKSTLMLCSRADAEGNAAQAEMLQPRGTSKLKAVVQTKMHCETGARPGSEAVFMKNKVIGQAVTQALQQPLLLLHFQSVPDIPEGRCLLSLRNSNMHAALQGKQ